MCGIRHHGRMTATGERATPSRRSVLHVADTGATPSRGVVGAAILHSG